MKKFIAIVLCLFMLIPGISYGQEIDLQILINLILQLQQQIIALQQARLNTSRTFNVSSSTGERYCFYSNLKYGQRNYVVTKLQKVLEIEEPTGFFGSQTLAAVKKYQADNGIDNTGYVGPLTRKALNDEFCNTDTATTLNLTSTTIDSTSTSTTLAVESTTTTLEDSTTTTTTLEGEESTTTTTLADREGSMTATAGSGDTVSQLSQDSTGADVYTFILEADQSSIDVHRVDINMTTSSQQLPWHVLSSLSLVATDGLGSEEDVSGEALATVDITEENLICNSFGRDYTVRFNDIDLNIPAGSTQEIYIEATAVYPQSLETITFKLPANAIRYTDELGIMGYTPSSDLASNAISLTTDTLDVEVELLASSSNVEKAVEINDNSVTEDVEAFYFTLSNDLEGDAFIKNITLTCATPSSNISEIFLYQGSTLVDSEYYNDSVSFAGMTHTLPAETDQDYTIKYTLKKNASGTIYGCTLSSSGIVAVNSTENSVTPTGSTVTGGNLHPYKVIPVVAFNSNSFTAVEGTNETEGDANVQFKITASGGNIYMNVLPGSTPTENFIVKLKNDSGYSATITDYTVDATNLNSSSENVKYITSSSYGILGISARIDDVPSDGYYYLAVESIPFSNTSSGTGYEYNYGLTDIKTSSLYLKEVDNDARIALSGSNDDRTIVLDEGETTTANAMLFTLTNAGTATATVSSIDVSVPDVDFINSVKLFDGVTELSSKTYATSISFDNLDLDVAGEGDKDLIVKYVLNNTSITEDTTVSAVTLATDDIEASKPDESAISITGDNVDGGELLLDIEA